MCLQQDSACIWRKGFGSSSLFIWVLMSSYLIPHYCPLGFLIAGLWVPLFLPDRVHINACCLHLSLIWFPIPARWVPSLLLYKGYPHKGGSLCLDEEGSAPCCEDSTLSHFSLASLRAPALHFSCNLLNIQQWSWLFMDLSPCPVRAAHGFAGHIRLNGMNVSKWINHLSVCNHHFSLPAIDCVPD